MAGWSDRYKKQVEYLTGAGLTGETTGGVSALSVMSTFIQAISQIIISFPEYIEDLQNQLETMQTEIEGLSAHIQNLQETKQDKEEKEIIYVKTAVPSIELSTNRKTYYSKLIGVFSNSKNKLKISADKTVQGLYVNGKAVTDISSGFTAIKPTDSGNYLLSIKSENVLNADKVTLHIADSSSDASVNFTIYMKNAKAVITKPYIVSTYSQSIGKFINSINSIQAEPNITTKMTYSKSIEDFANVKNARNINYVQVSNILK